MNLASNAGDAMPQGAHLRFEMHTAILGEQYIDGYSFWTMRAHPGE
jgi:hypothetical protein